LLSKLLDHQEGAIRRAAHHHQGKHAGAVLGGVGPGVVAAVEVDRDVVGGAGGGVTRARGVPGSSSSSSSSSSGAAMVVSGAVGKNRARSGG
jgi:hypothetical protein